MHRLLIVTGSYYPAVLADTHRARLLAPALQDLGWHVEILTAGVELQRPDAIEDDSRPFFDLTIPVYFAAPWGMPLFNLFNMRSIGWRAFWPIYFKGKSLLEEKRFDLVYFTTAQFNLFCLGRLWHWKYGIPYVLDFHDPWVRDELRITTTKHKLKFYVTALLSRWLERFAVADAAGVISVSPTYIEQLRERYSNAKSLASNRSAVIPFAAAEHDLAVPCRSVASDGGDIIYVGAGGQIMAESWRRILSLLDILQRQSATNSAVRFKFLGTEAFWKQGDRKFLVEIAKEYKLEGLVEEHPLRISYLQAIEAIKSSAGLIILGVDDPGYMPSKLFAYALSGKPLLACLHQNSQGNRYFEELPQLGHLIHFGQESQNENDLLELRAFLDEVKERHWFDRRELIGPYLAPSTAERHQVVFERCIENASHL